ncbi:bifunctional DNA primase/polymerase [Lentzea sp. NPDC059081]|uniref:bifunctional DNA primase/polymerase n=1 Tax=Lentzea sp. NPDC059081 TaxID=3346719 RepID=UPI0036CC5AEB
MTATLPVGADQRMFEPPAADGPLIDWAVFWAVDFGIPVFPLNDRRKPGQIAAGQADWSKRPRGACGRCKAAKQRDSLTGRACFAQCGHRLCHGLLGATTDVELIIEWWTRYPAANIGGVTGPYDGNATGTLLIEADVAKQVGDTVIDGRETLAAAIAGHGSEWPVTWQNISGGGGPHYLFAWPARARADGKPWANGVGAASTEDKIATGVDVRAAGGYVVLPPSETAKGAYTVATMAPLAQPPGWVLDRIDKQPRAQVIPLRSSSALRSNGYGTGRHKFDRLIDKLRTTHSGRNKALYNAAHSVAGLVADPANGISEQEARDALWGAAVANGYVAQDGEAEARGTLDSGFLSGLGRPWQPNGEAFTPTEQKLDRGTVLSIVATYGQGEYLDLGTVEMFRDVIGDDLWDTYAAPLFENDISHDANTIPSQANGIVPKAKKPRRHKEADEAHEQDAGLPDVVMTGRPLRDTSTDAAKFFAAAEAEDPHVFIYGDGELVELHPITGKLLRIDRDRLAVLLSQRMNFRDRLRDFETGAITMVHTSKIPGDVVAALYSGASLLRLPELKRITTLPYFTQDGELITALGYNPKTGVYRIQTPGTPQIPQVSAVPSVEEVRAAVAIFTDDLLTDFPFDTTADRTAAMAMPITLLAREMITGATPMFLVDTPRRGTGKGKLTTVLVRPFAPDFAFVLAPRDETEWPKSLVASMRTGRPVLGFDNIDAALNSAALAAAITEWPMVRNRLMGTHEEITLPTPGLWIGTGNNVVASSELARRIVRIRIDAGTETPEERTGFKHEDLIGWSEENSGQLVWAVLTMIQSWVAAGKPVAADLPRMGSFEKWVNVVGSIAAHVGLEGFLANRSAAASAIDVETELISTFCTTWANDPGEGPVKADGEIVKPGRESCANRPVRVDELLALVDAYRIELPEQIGPQGTDRRSRFGKWLRAKVIGAPVGPYTFSTTKPRNVAHFQIHDDGSGQFEEGGVTIKAPAA